jgi:hypothetical protein
MVGVVVLTGKPAVAPPVVDQLKIRFGAFVAAVKATLFPVQTEFEVEDIWVSKGLFKTNGIEPCVMQPVTASVTSTEYNRLLSTVVEFTRFNVTGEPERLPGVHRYVLFTEAFELTVNVKLVPEQITADDAVILLMTVWLTSTWTEAVAVQPVMLFVAVTT